jgi:hypothetical protein
MPVIVISGPESICHFRIIHCSFLRNACIGSQVGLTAMLKSGMECQLCDGCVGYHIKGLHDL